MIILRLRLPGISVEAHEGAIGINPSQQLFILIFSHRSLSADGGIACFSSRFIFRKQSVSMTSKALTLDDHLLAYVSWPPPSLTERSLFDPVALLLFPKTRGIYEPM